MDAEAEYTLDAFHRGAFWLVQPKGKGHRAGVDAMMLAAAIPSGFSGRVADFGAGAGAAGMAVAARCPGASALLVERAPDMVACARASLALKQNVVLAPRVSVLEADVSLAGKARAAAGLPDNGFDGVIMNPPFNAQRDRASPDALRQEAHVLTDGLFEAWLRSAAAVVRPGGLLVVVARPVSLPALLGACEGRFGSLRIVPVHPRADEAAIRIVLRGFRCARGAFSLEPALVLHGPTGHGFTERGDAINNGRGSLFGD